MITAGRKPNTKIVVENTIYKDNRSYLKNSGLSLKTEKTTRHF
jgi:hypothetical protein